MHLCAELIATSWIFEPFGEVGGFQVFQVVIALWKMNFGKL